MEEREIVVTIGIPGSGKSTYIDNNFIDYQLVCRDDIRLAFGSEFNQNVESYIRAIKETMIKAHMYRRRNIIVDETNTCISALTNYMMLAKTFGYKTKAIVFTVPIEICKDRRLTKGFPEEVIDRMSNQLKWLLDDEDLTELFDDVIVINGG